MLCKNFCALALLAVAPLVNAANIVTSPAALNANDTVDWGQLGSAGKLENPTFTATSAGGVVVTVNAGGVTALAAPGSYGLPGSTIDINNQFTGPLFITFSKPVSGAGAYISNAFLAAYSPVIQAFNGSNSLGTFTEAVGGGTIFMGVMDTTADITKIEFNTISSPGDGYFGLGALSLAYPTVVAPGADPPAPGTPEPSTMLLVGLGMAAAGFRMRFRSRRQRTR
jgi:hypothetical protein